MPDLKLSQTAILRGGCPQGRDAKPTPEKIIADQFRSESGDATYRIIKGDETVRALKDAGKVIVDRAKHEQLRSELERLVGVANNLIGEVEDPGTEALAAVYCAEKILQDTST